MISFRTVVASAVVAVVPVLVPVAAHADAWSAAKATLPAETSVLLGVNVASITKSETFTTLFPLALAKASDVKDSLDAIKTACHVDPLSAVKSVVVGTNDDQTSGAVFLTVKGIDQAALTACMPKGPELSWIGKDVIVVGFGDKAWAAKPGLARGAAGKLAAKVNTGSAAWGVSTVPKTLEDGVDMKRGYGTLTVSGGKLGVDLHVGVATAASAKEIAERMTKEIAGSKDQLSGDFATLLQSVQVRAAGDEVVVKTRVPEKTVLSLAGLLLRM